MRLQKMIIRQEDADISTDEIFVSDGAKSDSGNIQEIFAVDNRIAVCDPVYPVYVDSNVMAGRTGELRCKDRDMEQCHLYALYSRKIILHRNFQRRHQILFIFALPNNPTGTTITKDELQEWVDYANKDRSCDHL